MPLSLTIVNYRTFLINSLFSFIPISFIAGNLILNANIFLFIIFAIVFYGKDIPKVSGEDCMQEVRIVIIIASIGA